MKLEIIIGAFGTRGDRNTGVVEETIYPEEGGIFTKFVGCSYLYKGLPSVTVIKALKIPKNALRSFIKLFKSRFILILLVPFLNKWILLKVCQLYLEVAYVSLANEYNIFYITTKENGVTRSTPRQTPIILEPKRYCTAVGELHRALTVMIEGIKSKAWKWVANRTKNIFCMFLQYDVAYKFRFQDILPEIDIEKLKNPIKELKRVRDIFFERERSDNMKAKWNKMFKPLFLYLRFSRRARNLLVKLLSEIDYEKIKLDKADWYYCLNRYVYNYRGLSYDDRVAIKERIDKEKGHDIPQVRIVGSDIQIIK